MMDTAPCGIMKRPDKVVEVGCANVLIDIVKNCKHFMDIHTEL